MVSRKKYLMLGVIIGSMLSVVPAFASGAYLQAKITQTTVSMEGMTDQRFGSLSARGTTYLPVSALQQILTKAGMQSSWDANLTKLSVATQQLSLPTTAAIPVSKLPFSFTAQDGMKVTVNSIAATADNTTLNVTIENDGSKTDATCLLTTSITSISDNGPQVKYISNDDALDSNIQPGQSVTGNVVFDPLKQGATVITWYFNDFDFDSQHISIDLSK